MTFDPNDPRLTAYVLGELDPAERSEFEAMLEDSPDGRQAVEEIRRTIGWLSDQLREEQVHYAPTAESNHRPLTVMQTPPAGWARPRPWIVRRQKAMLAAMALLAMVGFVLLDISVRHREAAPQVALNKAIPPGHAVPGPGPVPRAQDAVDLDSTLSGMALPPAGSAALPAPAASDAISRGNEATPPEGLGIIYAEALADGEAKQGDAGVYASVLAGKPESGSTYKKLAKKSGEPQGQMASNLPAPTARDALGRTPLVARSAVGRQQSRPMVANPGNSGYGGGGNANQPGQPASPAADATRPMQERTLVLAPGAVAQYTPAEFHGNGQQGQGQAQRGQGGQQGQSGEGRGQGQQGQGQGQGQGQQGQAINAGTMLPRNNMNLGEAQNYAFRTGNGPQPAGANQTGGGGRGEQLIAKGKDRQGGQKVPMPAPGQNGANNAVAPAAPPQEVELAQVQAAPEPMPQAGEEFLPIVDNPFVATARGKENLSTFSTDVDTAGYAHVRRFLSQNMLPPKDAVRIEELLNYFPYNDAPPAASSPDPFAVHVEVAGCPWDARHRLARVGIAAKPIDQSRRPPSNLVFLIDVSGSMKEELPMIQWGLSQLVEQLNENDSVAIVVYASASGLVLPSKSCVHKAAILSTIADLRAEGSTNGGAGIQQAYDVAVSHFIKNGTNRVIWATDGDLNVGVTDQDALVKLFQEKAKSGVFLTVLGCGTGNIKDATLEKLADKGNGQYAYIDSPREAYRVLVEQMGSTLVAVAKDVKIQVDFDPASVSEFRLIGYENRIMDHQDFANDKKDAGDIGAGHHVTALYEIAPTRPVEPGRSTRLMTVKLRYKKPNEDASRLLEYPAVDTGTDFGHASDDLKLASAVAGFGMLLRDSRYKGTLTYPGALEIAQSILPGDRSGYRKELVDLVRKAQALPASQRAQQDVPAR